MRARLRTGFMLASRAGTAVCRRRPLPRRAWRDRDRVVWFAVREWHACRGGARLRCRAPARGPRHALHRRCRRSAGGRPAPAGAPATRRGSQVGRGTRGGAAAGAGDRVRASGHSDRRQRRPRAGGSLPPSGGSGTGRAAAAHPRLADFGALVPAIAEGISRRLDRAAPSFTQSALNVLAALPWRRNMQELEALLERSPPCGTRRRHQAGGRAGATLVRRRVYATRAPSASLREARLRFERDYIAAVLEHHHWRMSDAARALGIERANLYRKTRQLGISRATPAQTADQR